jgi:hypothetical protein
MPCAEGSPTMAEWLGKKFRSRSKTIDFKVPMNSMTKKNLPIEDQML